jgi:hypothetical protein
MTRPTEFSHPLWTMLVLCSALAAVPALAAGNAAPESRDARYRRDVAACKVAPPGTDRAACLREAGAVRAIKDPVRTESDTEPFARNALMRCERLPELDRKECVARIEGQGSTSGSVAEGGILRELVTPGDSMPTPPPAAGSGTAPAK